MEYRGVGDTYEETKAFIIDLFKSMPPEFIFENLKRILNFIKSPAQEICCYLNIQDKYLPFYIMLVSDEAFLQSTFLTNKCKVLANLILKTLEESKDLFSLEINFGRQKLRSVVFRKIYSKIYSGATNKLEPIKFEKNWLLKTLDFIKSSENVCWYPAFPIQEVDYLFKGLLNQLDKETEYGKQWTHIWEALQIFKLRYEYFISINSTPFQHFKVIQLAKVALRENNQPIENKYMDLSDILSRSLFETILTLIEMKGRTSGPIVFTSTKDSGEEFNVPRNELSTEERNITLITEHSDTTNPKSDEIKKANICSKVERLQNNTMEHANKYDVIMSDIEIVNKLNSNLIAVASQLKCLDENSYGIIPTKMQLKSTYSEPTEDDDIKKSGFSNEKLLEKKLGQLEIIGITASHEEPDNNMTSPCKMSHDTSKIGTQNNSRCLEIINADKNNKLATEQYSNNAVDISKIEYSESHNVTSLNNSDTKKHIDNSDRKGSDLNDRPINSNIEKDSQKHMDVADSKHLDSKNGISLNYDIEENRSESRHLVSYNNRNSYNEEHREKHIDVSDSKHPDSNNAIESVHSNNLENSQNQLEVSDSQHPVSSNHTISIDSNNEEHSQKFMDGSYIVYSKASKISEFLKYYKKENSYTNLDDIYGQNSESNTMPIECTSKEPSHGNIELNTDTSIEYYEVEMSLEYNSIGPGELAYLCTPCTNTGKDTTDGPSDEIPMDISESEDDIKVATENPFIEQIKKIQKQNPKDWFDKKIAHILEGKPSTSQAVLSNNNGIEAVPNALWQPNTKNKWFNPNYEEYNNFHEDVDTTDLHNSQWYPSKHKWVNPNFESNNNSFITDIELKHDRNTEVRIPVMISSIDKTVKKLTKAQRKKRKIVEHVSRKFIMDSCQAILEFIEDALRTTLEFTGLNDYQIKFLMQIKDLSQCVDVIYEESCKQVVSQLYQTIKEKFEYSLEVKQTKGNRMMKTRYQDIRDRITCENDYRKGAVVITKVPRKKSKKALATTQKVNPITFKKETDDRADSNAGNIDSLVLFNSSLSKQSSSTSVGNSSSKASSGGSTSPPMGSEDPYVNSETPTVLTEQMLYVQSGTSSVQSGTSPVQSESSPVQTVTSHVQSESAPMQSDSSNVHSESSPVQSVTSPVQSESSLVHSESSPVQSESSPMQSELSPIHSESSPVQSVTSPVHSASSPMQCESSLKQSVISPVQSESSPVQSATNTVQSGTPSAQSEKRAATPTVVSEMFATPKLSVAVSKKSEKPISYTSKTALKELAEMQEKLIAGLCAPLESDKAMRMMRLMGWQGGALGVRDGGLIEPIKPQLNVRRRVGLGHQIDAVPTKLQQRVLKSKPYSFKHVDQNGNAQMVNKNLNRAGLIDLNDTHSVNKNLIQGNLIDQKKIHSVNKNLIQVAVINQNDTDKDGRLEEELNLEMSGKKKKSKIDSKGDFTIPYTQEPQMELSKNRMLFLVRLLDLLLSEDKSYTIMGFPRTTIEKCRKKRRKIIDCTVRALNKRTVAPAHCPRARLALAAARREMEAHPALRLAWFATKKSVTLIKTTENIDPTLPFPMALLPKNYNIEQPMVTTHQVADYAHYAGMPAGLDHPSAVVERKKMFINRIVLEFVSSSDIKRVYEFERMQDQARNYLDALVSLLNRRQTAYDLNLGTTENQVFREMLGHTQNIFLFVRYDTHLNSFTKVQFKKIDIGGRCLECQLQLSGKPQLSWTDDKQTSTLDNNSNYKLNSNEITNKNTIMDVSIKSKCIDASTKAECNDSSTDLNIKKQYTQISMDTKVEHEPITNIKEMKTLVNDTVEHKSNDTKSNDSLQSITKDENVNEFKIKTVVSVNETVSTDKITEALTNDDDQLNNVDKILINIENTNVSTGEDDNIQINTLNSTKPNSVAQCTYPKTVLIVHYKYPKYEVGVDSAILIQSFLYNGLMRAKEFPRIKCCGIQNGGLVYTCYDSISQVWLNEQLQSYFKIININKELNTKHIIAMKINTFIEVNFNVILSNIKSYYSDLDTSKWKVLNTKEILGLCIITIEIDELSLDRIKAEGYSLFVGFDKADISVVYE